jgi:hypothetical protein
LRPGRRAWPRRQFLNLDLRIEIEFGIYRVQISQIGISCQIIIRESYSAVVEIVVLHGRLVLGA